MKMNWEPGSKWRTWFFYVERPLVAGDRTIPVKFSFDVLEKHFGINDLTVTKYHEYAERVEDKVLDAVTRRLRSVPESEYPLYLSVTPQDLAA